MTDQPDTVPAFEELGLSSAVLKAVADMGYAQPSPVQAEAIPFVLQGRDVLAAAQTGTGKTAAFVLPTLDRLPHHRKHEGPFMLVLTPTRELAQQIVDVCQTVGRRTSHRTLTVVGGVSYNPQRAGFARGVDVVVATPGRLEDLLGTGDARLDQVKVLVLDEADRMLDMGFLPSIRRIVAACPAERQTLLFSATLDDSAIEGVKDLVHDPARVEIARRGTAAETIEQFVLPVSRDAKNDLLVKVLEREGGAKVIVFCRTKHRADTVSRRLTKAGIKAAPIHGDRSQAQRNRALKAFRDGRVNVLVATDVLARGIDVPDVDYVVNFDVPEDPEDYVHRIGRTGRAGEAGWALTFVTPDDLDDLLATEALMERTVPTFDRTDGLELGDDLPELDPDREPAKIKNMPKSGAHRKSRAKAAAVKAVRHQARQNRKKSADGDEAPRKKGQNGEKRAKAKKKRADKPAEPKTRDKAPKKGQKAAKPNDIIARKKAAAEADEELMTKGEARKPKKRTVIKRDAKHEGHGDDRRGHDGKGHGKHVFSRDERGPKHDGHGRKKGGSAKRRAKPGDNQPWQSYDGPRKQRPLNGGRRRPGDKGGKKH